LWQEGGNIGWPTAGNLNAGALFRPSKPSWLLLDFSLVNMVEASDVDIAVKLNVLVICAVFAFVGAILLGAF
jgi:hypothetical protein